MMKEINQFDKNDHRINVSQHFERKGISENYEIRKDKMIYMRVNHGDSIYMRYYFSLSQTVSTSNLHPFYIQICACA